MCSSPEKHYKIELEGGILNVCEKCSSYGRIIANIQQDEPEKKKSKQGNTSKDPEIKPQKETETLQLITSNYALLIKSAREKLDLKQKELAKKIAEKESVIHKLESGHREPDIMLARKLEKFLRINLIEEVELDSSKVNAEKKQGPTESLTLGDMIKIK